MCTEQEFEGEEKEWRFLGGARKAGRSKELTWEVGTSLCLFALCSFLGRS